MNFTGSVFFVYQIILGWDVRERLTYYRVWECAAANFDWDRGGIAVWTAVSCELDKDKHQGIGRGCR